MTENSPNPPGGAPSVGAISEEACCIASHVPECQFTRGRALMNVDRMADAADAFQKALDQKPDYLVARQNLAACQTAIGDWQKGH